MSTLSQSSQREFKEWSLPAVKLLQGVVYADEERAWDILLRSRSSLESYFLRIGLHLVVNEEEGYAFLRQLESEEMAEGGGESLPKLIRRVPLGYSATVLAVLLRDELRKLEDEDLHNERCVVESSALFQQWKMFFPPQHDEVKQEKEYRQSLSKLEDLGFVRPFAGAEESWEVRRVLKARLTAEDLEGLKTQLTSHVAERNEKGGQDR